MKTILLPLLVMTLTVQPSLGGNWLGSGPWANAAYYPGALDGKYQASVTGVNTAGVLGFAIRDGSVPFLQIETQSTGDALVTDSVVVNQTLEIDQTVNYYAVFVNGRTYTGTTAAGININADSIFGTLLGTQPTTLTNTNSTVSSTLFTNTVVDTLTNNISTISSFLITNTTISPVLVTNTTISSILVTNTTVVGGLTNTTVSTVFITNSVAEPGADITITTVSTEFITNSVSEPGATITNATVSTEFTTNSLLNPVLISTGVDGSFQANVTGKAAVFTFQGPGSLTSPGLVVNGQQSNTTTAFTVNGIRTSFSSQAVFQSVNNNSSPAQ